jgi:hypothetical protein
MLTTEFSKFFGRTRPDAPPILAAHGLGERRALHAELAREEVRRTEEAARYVRQAADANAHVEQARGFLRDAQEHVAELNATELTASHASSLRVDRIHACLRAGASPAIAAFLSELSELCDRVRAAGIETMEHSGPLNQDGRRPTLISTNAESVSACLAAIRAAHTGAAALQLEVLDEATIATRLETLRASIPDIAPLMVEALPILTPAEQREAEWRAAEAGSR